MALKISGSAFDVLKFLQTLKPTDAVSLEVDGATPQAPAAGKRGRPAGSKNKRAKKGSTPGTCSVIGCPDDAAEHGFCETHAKKMESLTEDQAKKYFWTYDAASQTLPEIRRGRKTDAEKAAIEALEAAAKAPKKAKKPSKKAKAEGEAASA